MDDNFNENIFAERKFNPLPLNFGFTDLAPKLTKNSKRAIFVEYTNVPEPWLFFLRKRTEILNSNIFLIFPWTKPPNPRRVFKVSDPRLKYLHKNSTSWCWFYIFMYTQSLPGLDQKNCTTFTKLLNISRYDNTFVIPWWYVNMLWINTNWCAAAQVSRVSIILRNMLVDWVKSRVMREKMIDKHESLVFYIIYTSGII